MRSKTCTCILHKILADCMELHTHTYGKRWLAELSNMQKKEITTLGMKIARNNTTQKQGKPKRGEKLAVFHLQLFQCNSPGSQSFVVLRHRGTANGVNLPNAWLSFHLPHTQIVLFSSYNWDQVLYLSLSSYSPIRVEHPPILKRLPTSMNIIIMFSKSEEVNLLFLPGLQEHSLGFGKRALPHNIIVKWLCCSHTKQMALGKKK